METFLADNDIEFMTEYLFRINDIEHITHAYLDTESYKRLVAKSMVLWGDNQKNEGGELYLVVAKVDTQIDFESLNK